MAGQSVEPNGIVASETKSYDPNATEVRSADRETAPMTFAPLAGE